MISHLSSENMTDLFFVSARVDICPCLFAISSQMSKSHKKTGFQGEEEEEEEKDGQ